MTVYFSNKPGARWFSWGVGDYTHGFYIIKIEIAPAINIQFMERISSLTSLLGYFCKVRRTKRTTTYVVSISLFYKDFAKIIVYPNKGKMHVRKNGLSTGHSD